MTLSAKLRDILYEPRVRSIDVDAPDFLSVHAQILREKPILHGTFLDFYRQMSRLCDTYVTGQGREIELGSGAGFFHEVRPAVEKSDIRTLPGIPLVLDAQKMELSDQSERCIYAINVFHHLPEPERFFQELKRVLTPGGGCILIEPHGGPASAALHRRLHKDEYFDPNANGWSNTNIRGPLSGANQALSHIVFERDFVKFEKEHGHDLSLVHREYCTNGLRYLISGGLNFRQLMPSATAGILRGIETALSSIARTWTFHHALVLRRN
jgi:SAM-dependent methyltransferase